MNNDNVPRSRAQPPAIDFDEGKREGYLNIFHQDDEYHLELHVGVQSFRLHYSDDNYESVKWYANQFAHALNRTVGDVRLYGTEPARLDDPDEGYDEDETQNKQENE